MWPFSPSKTQQALFALVQQDRALAAESQAKTLALMERFVEATQKQQEFLTGYIQLFSQAPSPKVRVMDDAAEALQEARRALKREDLPRPRPIETPPVSIPDFSALFESLKQDVI